MPNRSCTDVQHRVLPGESLATISKRYGVELTALRSANPKIGKRLKAGSAVRVPTRDDYHPIEAASVKPIPKATTAKVKVVSVAAHPQPSEPAHRTHTVRSGQTLTQISKQYRVSVESVRKMNGLGKSTLIKPGQKLRIPAASARTG